MTHSSPLPPASGESHTTREGSDRTPPGKISKLGRFIGVYLGITNPAIPAPQRGTGRQAQEGAGDDNTTLARIWLAVRDNPGGTAQEAVGRLTVPLRDFMEEDLSTLVRASLGQRVTKD